MGNSAAKGVFFSMPKIADVTSVKSNITPSKALDQADQSTLSSKNLLGTLESKKSVLDTKLTQLLIEPSAKAEESSDCFRFNAALDRANENELIEAATQNLLAAPTLALLNADPILAKTAILYFIAFRKSAIKRTKENVGILKPTTIDMLVNGFEAEIKTLQALAKNLNIRVPHSALREKPSDELMSKLILDPLLDEIIRDVLFWNYPEEWEKLCADYDLVSLERDCNSAEPEDYDADDEDAETEESDEEEEADLGADNEEASEEDEDLDVDAEDFENMDDEQEEENDEGEDIEAGAEDIEEMDMDDEAEEENDEDDDENEDDDEEEDDEENDDTEESEEELDDTEDELEIDDIDDEIDANAEEAVELDDENQFEEAGASEENEAGTIDSSDIDSVEAQDELCGAEEVGADKQLISLVEQASYNLEFLMRYLDNLLESGNPLHKNTTSEGFQELLDQMDYQSTRLSL